MDLAYQLVGLHATSICTAVTSRETGALLDVTAQQPPHDLRGRSALFRTQPLEQLLLARIDQDGQSVALVAAITLVEDLLQHVVA
jgi:hypothetical protein